MLHISVGTLLWFHFWFCVFFTFLFNCLISFCGSFVCVVVLLLFVLFGSVFVSFVCVCVYFLVSVLFVDSTFYHLSGVLLFFFFFNPLYCQDE